MEQTVIYESDRCLARRFNLILRWNLQVRYHVYRFQTVPSKIMLILGFFWILPWIMMWTVAVTSCSKVFSSTFLEGLRRTTTDFKKAGHLVEIGTWNFPNTDRIENHSCFPRHLHCLSQTNCSHSCNVWICAKLVCCNLLFNVKPCILINYCLINVCCTNNICCMF
jgi:hypothetical protein